MLILTRKPGESLYIGDSVKITIVEIKGNQIRVGIDAPTDLRIYREEIYMQILEENRKAAESPAGLDSGLEGLSKAWKGRVQVEQKSSGLGSFSSISTSRVSADLGRSEKRGSNDPQVVIKRKKGPSSNE